MGHHWNPRAYLRHFACRGQPDRIWVYDKKKREWQGGRPLPIAGVAQAPEFYTDETELHLAAIEGAASEPLRRLRNGEQLTEADRERVSEYLSAFLARSPVGRKVAMAQQRKWAEAGLEDLSSHLQRLGLPITEAARSEELLQARRREVENDDPFRVESDVVRSFPSDYPSHTRLRPLMLSLGWLVVKRPSSGGFVTGDSPVAVGPGHFQFPLAADLCLVCTKGRSPERTDFLDCPGHLARRINRKTIWSSERFVYSPRREDWVATVAGKEPSSE